MSKPLVPEIRFGGYSEPWEQHLFGDITTSYSGGTPQVGVKDYYGGNIPFIRSGEIHQNTTELFITEKGYNESSAAMVEKGDILLALYGATSGEVAISQIDGAINQAILAVKPNTGYSANVITHWLERNKKDLLNTYLQGGQGNLSGSIVKSFLLTIPQDFKEQNAIGEWFKRLDDMIANAEKEVARLEKMKIASLQKMFPRPGQTTPEIRFGGFTEPWIEKRFSDVYMPLKNNTLSRDCLNDNNGIAQNIHYGDVLIRYKSIVNVSTDKVPFVNGDIQLEISKSNLLINGDVVFADTAEDETVGKCTEISGVGDYAVVSGLHTIPVRPKFEFAPLYLGYFHNSESYHTQLLPLMQGVKVLSVSKSAIADTLIYYPTSIEEQKLIGEYFNNLDCIIEAKRDRIVKLRNIKKACLEKMFVNNTTEQ